jgi:hypothetical protein
MDHPTAPRKGPKLFAVYLCRTPGDRHKMAWAAVPLDARWEPTEPVPGEPYNSFGVWPAEGREEAIKAARKTQAPSREERKKLRAQVHYKGGVRLSYPKLSDRKLAELLRDEYTMKDGTEIPDDVVSTCLSYFKSWREIEGLSPFPDHKLVYRKQAYSPNARRFREWTRTYRFWECWPTSQLTYRTHAPADAKPIKVRREKAS